MTYDQYEISAEEGQPVELFTFTAGADIYRYTSDGEDFPLGVFTYRAVSIKRGDMAQGSENRDHDFTVELPVDDEVAQLFTGIPSGVRVRLTVLRCHRSDLPSPETVRVFDGYVQATSFVDMVSRARITARSVLASARRQVPARKYQGTCPHRLYDPATCKVDDTDPAYRASTKDVVGQVGNVITVDGLGGFAAGWFTGGYVEGAASGFKRLILDDDGAGNLTIMIPFAVAPTFVNVYAGCAHDGENCHDKFDNLVNNGGFEFVPKRNIFTGGIL